MIQKLTAVLLLLACLGCRAVTSTSLNQPARAAQVSASPTVQKTVPVFVTNYVARILYVTNSEPHRARWSVPITQRAWIETVTITNWIPATNWTDRAGRVWFRDREMILTNEVSNVTDSLGQRHSHLLTTRGGETGRSRLTPAMASGSFTNSMKAFYSQPRRGELPELPK